MKHQIGSSTRRTRFNGAWILLVALASFTACVEPSDESETDELHDELDDRASNFVGSDYCRTKLTVRTNAGDTFDCLDAVDSELITSDYAYDITEMVYPLSGNAGVAFQASPHGPWRADCDEDECEGQRPVDGISTAVGLSLRDSQGRLVEADGETSFRRITVMSPSHRDDRTSRLILAPFRGDYSYLVDPIEIEADILDGFELVVEPAAQLPEEFAARLWFTMSAEHCQWDWVAGFCRERR